MSSTLRDLIRQHGRQPEGQLMQQLVAQANLDASARASIASRAADLVRQVRDNSDPSLMEAFLGEYGLSTDEGVALMCLAEALLRVPDADTIDDLIADKITASDWDTHSGKASSVLVNASTWALMLTGRVLNERQDAGIGATLHGILRRVGEPLVRTAVGQAMREMGRQFVLGQTIDKALDEAQEEEQRGYTYSYDMLGEGARTDADAKRYHLAYASAITTIARRASGSVRDNPGISVKLSALHPRYETTQREQMFDTLVTRTRSLAVLAAGSNLGFNIDAEEADRLDISLDLIEAVLADKALKGWDGFGVVVQAYGRRAAPVLDWLYDLAQRLGRRIMVRLVKGAYWDTEIKHAQVLGLADYPVFTRKVNTDLSYISCAGKLLAMTKRIYPQFATHNAHSAAAVLHLAEQQGVANSAFEFQRLHGMGEALHQTLRDQAKTRCRIYAPVGVHKDLLAYLVRRLLENGANSSFVHQIVDAKVPAETIAADPFAELAALAALGQVANPGIPAPAALFPGRRNSQGWNIAEPDVLVAMLTSLAPWQQHQWRTKASISTSQHATGTPLINPARPDDVVGWVEPSTQEQVAAALAEAAAAQPQWAATSPADRAICLEAAADLMEAQHSELLALLIREAGKTLADAIAELREAVDFLRYYAAEARTGSLPTAQGLFTCISPWNFPLAIFTGQVAAALVTGNAVLAKPAEQTPLVASRAVALLHQAGVPAEVLQLLPGDGPGVGAALCSDPRVAGVCFTGSTSTAQRINRTMAEHLDPGAPLIAETGGINAMLVDSTALPEQAVRDIIASAFQSAGQRCSALRVLYLQEDIAERFLAMLYGAMDALVVGDPWEVSTDVGPVIDAAAASSIRRYLAAHPPVHAVDTAATSLFVPPCVLQVSGIDAVEREIFGPVLHVVRFPAEELDAVIQAINNRGFGLTFGVHTRLDDRVQYLVDQLRVGNIYVNRNQIGAVVGAQPFGGEGLSGTGPKAGGPHYLQRFCRAGNQAANADSTETPAADSPKLSLAQLQDSINTLPETLPDRSPWADRDHRLDQLRKRHPDSAAVAAAAKVATLLELPGPTGERNVLRLYPRGRVLCLGPMPGSLLAQMLNALAAGCPTLVCDAAGALDQAVADLAAAGAPVASLRGVPSAAAVGAVSGVALVARSSPDQNQQLLRQALAARDGPILPLVTAPVAPLACLLERQVCTDTTAAGGNAALMANTESVPEVTPAQ